MWRSCEVLNTILTNCYLIMGYIVCHDRAIFIYFPCFCTLRTTQVFVKSCESRVWEIIPRDYCLISDKWTRIYFRVFCVSNSFFFLSLLCGIFYWICWVFQEYRSWWCRVASAKPSRRRARCTRGCWSATWTCFSCSSTASLLRWSTALTQRYVNCSSTIQLKRQHFLQLRGCDYRHSRYM